MIYQKPKAYWNKVFSKEEIKVPNEQVIPIEELEEAMNWLIKDGDTVLDFGCGNGTLLLYGNLKGAERLVGIDISEAGIDLARERAKHMTGQYELYKGDVKTLKKLKEGSFDSVILSNIIDNLIEEDMLLVLSEVHRLLKTNGKLMVKINDYIDETDYEKHKIKVIDNDLLDDGLLLLNKTTDAWRTILGQWFNIKKELTVNFKKFDIVNRMFLLKK